MPEATKSSYYLCNAYCPFNAPSFDTSYGPSGSPSLYRPSQVKLNRIITTQLGLDIHGC